MIAPDREIYSKQLDAQSRATRSQPFRGFPYRVAHVNGRITNHRTFEAAEKAWKFGDVGLPVAQ